MTVIKRSQSFVKWLSSKERRRFYFEFIASVLFILFNFCDVRHENIVRVKEYCKIDRKLLSLYIAQTQIIKFSIHVKYSNDLSK